MGSKNIYVSYRRPEDQALASEISRHLTQADPRHAILPTNIEAQSFVFEDLIATDRIRDCDVILVLITDGWIRPANFGALSLRRPSELTCSEINTALIQDKGIVAVLVDSARMPTTDELPESIATFVSRPSRDLKIESFAEDILKLAKFIDGLEFSGGSWKSVNLSDVPTPVANVPSPFQYGWSASSKLAVVSGPQNTPFFPYISSETDHAKWLDVCRVQVERLIEDVEKGGLNIRPAYREALKRYRDDLPKQIGDGNFMLADAEARAIRNMFQAEADILPASFTSRLRVFLEHHIAMRNFYPEVSRFYGAARDGRLEEALPQDAVEAFATTVLRHTPQFFERNVSDGLMQVELQATVELPPDYIRQYPAGTIFPPADPLGDLDPGSSKSFMTASSVNSLFEAFLKGKDLPVALTGWTEAVHRLGEHAAPIIAWLKTFAS